MSFIIDQIDERSRLSLPFTLRQLEIFDAVIRAGTLTGAARELHTAQSSISSAIDELERQVSQRLLIRRKAQGVQPTGAGRQFHQEVQEILRAAYEAGRLLQERDGQLRGPLAVGVYQTLAPYVLPLVLGEFGRDHPLVKLSFTETHQAGLMPALKAGAIDVAFSYPHGVPEEVEARVILERSPYVLLPSGHRLAGRESLALADIADEPLVLLGDGPSKAISLRVLGISAEDPRIVWQTSSRSVARALVGAGLGVTMVVQPDASPCTVDGYPLVEIPLLADTPNVKVQAAWLKPAERRRPPRRVSALVDFMYERFPQHIRGIDERRAATATLG